MRNLISHIEFLILEHECVIIPNLGGFVLNKELAYIDVRGVVVPPSFSIGFNADLKYNDGLLAESYMQKSLISYDAASSQIENTVKQLKEKLISGISISFGTLGLLRLSVDGHVLFEPASRFYMNHPDVWGYSTLRLKNLEEITAYETDAPYVKRIRFKQIALGLSAAAVATWMFLMIPLNGNFIERVQQSGFITSSAPETARAFKTNLVSLSDNISWELLKERRLANKEAVKPLESEQSVVTNKLSILSEKGYYIIVGGEVSKIQAERLLSTFQSRGFSKASMLESPDRYRIYVASFSDKDEANSYLDRFRKEHPENNDAWLYTYTKRK